MQDDNTGSTPTTPLAQPYSGGSGQGGTPDQPMAGAQPTQPADASQPIQPLEGAQPAQPVQPIEPVQPTTPEVTMNTPQPIQPAQPVQETQPQQPLASPTPMPAGGTVPPTPPPLSDAPESFTQREPSSFDMGMEPTKKKRGFPLFACIIVLFFLVFLAFGGLTAVAYFTDTEIPFFSDLADKIEKMLGGGELTAQEVQNEVADTLISAVLPFISGNEGVMSALAESAVSEEYVQNFINNNEGIQSVRFDVDASMTSTGGDAGVGSMSGKFVGAVDSKEAGNEKFETTVDGNIESGGLGLAGKGELKVIGNMTYIKIDEMPPLGAEYEQIKGKWIETEAEDVETVKEQTTTAETAEPAKQVTEEDINNLQTFVTDKAVVKNVEVMPDENIKGNDSKCLRFSWNKDELKDVMKRYSEIFGEAYNEQEVDEGLDGLTLLQMEACLGTDTNNIHRIKLYVEGNNEGNAFSYNINAILWDYNKDMNIQAPTDSVTFEEVMQDIIPPVVKEEEEAFVIPENQLKIVM